MSPALIQLIISLVSKAVEEAPEIISAIEALIAAAKGDQSPIPPAK
jgi:hypothetical protein